MRLDLHVHLSPFSSCSCLSLEELFASAGERGLDGVCITDHGRYDGYRAASAAAGEHALAVFMGVEITTCGGDMLVYSEGELPLEEVPFGVDPQRLIDVARDCGGLCFAAHPFRTSALSLGGRLQSLRGLKGVETRNGNCSPAQNAAAEASALGLDLLAVGGSDAHSAGQLGTWYTEFDHDVADQAAFVAALARGLVRPAGPGTWLEG